MDSILNSIKKLLGITEEYKHFDTDITMHINSVFMTLNQIGIGPSAGFCIKDVDHLNNLDTIREANAKKQQLTNDFFDHLMDTKVKKLYDNPFVDKYYEDMADEEQHNKNWYNNY